MRHGEKIAGCAGFVKFRQHYPVLHGVARGFIVRGISPVDSIALEYLLRIGYINVFLNTLIDSFMNPAPGALPYERHLSIGGVCRYLRGRRRRRRDIVIVIQLLCPVR